jgi:hypothetical protein
MTMDQVLFGVALILVLAAGSQVGPALTGPGLLARDAAGARISETRGGGSAEPAADVLFTISPAGKLEPTTSDHERVPQPEDTLVVLSDNGVGVPG